MKRMIAIVLVILAMTTVLAGCGGTQSDTGMTNGSTGASSNETGMGSNNGGSSGTNANGSYGTDDMTTVPDAGNGTPSSNENGIIDEEPSAARDDNVIEDFGNDMQDVMDNAGSAVQDAVEGRRSHNGTGMTGGR